MSLFDHSCIDFPLRLEPAGLGRSMRPFGMKGRRKVRDLLAEAGIPRAKRGSYPLIVDSAGEVLWIPLVRASDHAQVGPGCAEAIILYTVAASGSTPTVSEKKR